MQTTNARYYAFNKPFGYLSQFTDEGNRQGFGRILDLSNDVYPVGRLDADSEGLLLLTNDKRVNHLLLDPLRRHVRTYWVQVEGSPEDAALKRFEQPMRLNIRKQTYVTLPASGRVIEAPEVWERDPPIRVRKSVPDGWIEMQLTEGKNRQVRKMTAAIGYPTLRLIRAAIEDLHLDGLEPGGLRAYEAKAFYELLKI